VPLSSRAIDLLEGLPRSISGKVFPIDEESTKRTFIRLVRRARQGYEEECAKSGSKADPAMLVNLHFHDLRHEATSRLAEIFMPQELAKVTGHKTLQMIMRYYHPRAEDLARKLG
jgi:integrase